VDRFVKKSQKKKALGESRLHLTGGSITGGGEKKSPFHPLIEREGKSGGTNQTSWIERVARESKW